jgi:eukaryotic-like serine/threonine-protein kinase
LCDVKRPQGGAWSEDGVILFGDVSGLQRIRASGGTPALVKRINEQAGESTLGYPQFLPGGKEFIYLVRHVEPSKTGIYIRGLDAPANAPSSQVAKTDYKADYDAGSGLLLYIDEAGLLMAQKLELTPPSPAGDPVMVAEEVRASNNTGYADFSISLTGTLFYGQERARRMVRFGWRDRAGAPLGMIGRSVDAVGWFSISPDGNRVAYFGGKPGSDIWVLDLGLGLHTRVTFNRSALAHWSPEGTQLYYSKADGIYRKAADGSGEEQLLVKGRRTDYVRSVSPDGRFLLFGLGDLMKLPLTGERNAAPYLRTKYTENEAAFSPDGRWVAYDSDESGRSEIYVQGFPESRGKWPVSAEGGVNPEWRSDGKELYWRGPGNTVMAVSVELQPAGVRPGRAQPLFQLPESDTNPFFQPSPDGRRFLVQEPQGQQQDTMKVVVQNWAGQLGK